MLKKNNTKTKELPEEPELTEHSDIEEEAVHEDEFDGPLDALELENDEFDDWNPELDIPCTPKVPVTTKQTTVSLTDIHKKNLQEINIPTKFICPLSKQLMTEPVRIAGSKVPIAYEKSALEAHYEESGTDPMTHEYLTDDVEFIPDMALKRAISDFCLAHFPSTEESPA